MGLGPVSLGGKLGFGAGGYGGPGDTLYYDQPSEEQVGAEGVHVAGQLAVGAGDVGLEAGAGVAGGIKPGQYIRVPAFIKNIPGYIRAIPSYLPSLPSWSLPSWSLPSWGWGSDDDGVEYVEYDPNDTEGWVPAPELDTASWSGNILGFQVDFFFFNKLQKLILGRSGCRSFRS